MGRVPLSKRRDPIPEWAPFVDPGEWRAFAAYDFKPFLLRGLSPEGREAVASSTAWEAARPGTAAWAESWLARPEEETIPAGISTATV